MAPVSLRFHSSHCPFSAFNTLLPFSASSLPGADFASDFTEKTAVTGWWTTWLPLLPNLQTQYLHPNHHCLFPLVTEEEDALLHLRAVLPPFSGYILSYIPRARSTHFSIFHLNLQTFPLFFHFLSYSTSQLHFTDFPSTFLTPPQSPLKISISFLGNLNHITHVLVMPKSLFPTWLPWTLTDGA